MRVFSRTLVTQEVSTAASVVFTIGGNGKKGERGNGQKAEEPFYFSFHLFSIYPFVPLDM